jgi:hypothetical protein
MLHQTDVMIEIVKQRPLPPQALFGLTGRSLDRCLVATSAKCANITKKLVSIDPDLALATALHIDSGGRAG